MVNAWMHWPVAGVGGAWVIGSGWVCIPATQNPARLGTQLQSCQSTWKRCWKTAQVRFSDSLIFVIQCSWNRFPSVLWHCWLGDRKGIRPVKNWVLVCWWWWYDWSFARLNGIAPVAPPLPGTIILCFNKHLLTQVHLEKCPFGAVVNKSNAG